MFTLAHPLALLLLLPVAAAAACVYRRRVRQALLCSVTSRLPPARHTWRMLLAAVLPALFIAGLALGVLALARPQTVLSTTVNKTRALAIEMVVDMSGSMQALDLTEGSLSGANYKTRLDVVKETFADFVRQRPDDLVGLVTFGGYAATRCPLTTDHEALLHVLKGVEIPDRQGVNDVELATAIGDGLATGLARLQKVEVKSKLVVLLSDGESNAGIIQPAEAMQAAKKLGVKVYTIGVGTPGAVTHVLVKDNFGRPRFQPAQFSLDERLLRSIADTTGGQYFQVRDAGGLERALEDINKLEQTEIKREVYNQYREWFPWLLVPALGLVLLSTGLGMVTTKRLI